MRRIFDCILIGEFADTQKRAATVSIAGGVPAFGIHMDVAEMQVRRVVNAHRSGKRSARTRHPITMIVGDGDVLRVIEFERQSFKTLTGFFFSLRCVDVPIFYVVELDLVAHVVFG